MAGETIGDRSYPDYGHFAITSLISASDPKQTCWKRKRRPRFIIVREVSLFGAFISSSWVGGGISLARCLPDPARQHRTSVPGSGTASNCSESRPPPKSTSETFQFTPTPGLFPITVIALREFVSKSVGILYIDTNSFLQVEHKPLKTINRPILAQKFH